MQDDMIKTLITRFNNLIDSLIEDLKEFKLDEETLVFLAEKTRNFINFSELALLNVIFTFLEKTADFNFDEEIKISKAIIKKIFEDINNSLNNILKHEDEEEHNHTHDHNHEHKHHVDIENVQADIDFIIAKLEFLKKMLGDIINMVLVSIKYQNEDIDEKKFKSECNMFKEHIKDYKETFEN